MTQIYLVRHAEAEGNLYRRIHGHYDSLITDLGYRQIAALAHRFESIHVDAVYSSDLFRTRTTAGAIYKPKGLPLVTRKALREVSMGVWEDRPWGEVHRTDAQQLAWFNATDARWGVEGGETFQRLRERISAAIRQIARNHPGQTVAVVSHVPHIMASSLMQLASRHADDQQALMRLAAGGFKDSTRIAAGSPELWCGIAFDNKDALSDGLDEIQGIIGAFADALASDDRASLTTLLADAAAARRALPAAWVPSTERLLEVRIPMEARPGVVAEVTTVTSSVGCNIQSIEIDHVTEDSAVLSLVLTDEGDIGQLSAQLINAGFSVSFSPLTAKEHTHVA